MEILITLAYIFFIHLFFYHYKVLKFTLLWKFIVFGAWCVALLTEIILLGQFAPYSKQAFVQAYVVQMAPVFGGRVKQVYARANIPLKKGDPLFQMDPEPWQSRVDQYMAQLSAANTSVSELFQQTKQAESRVDNLVAQLQVETVKYNQIKSAALAKAASQMRLETASQKMASLTAGLKGAKAALKSAQIALNSRVGDQPTAVAQVQAELDKALYNLKHTTIRAPSDGYVSNMQLHPGSFIRLKTPVMTFISSDEYWVVAKVLQNGIQRVSPGDDVELAFAMYPGKVFKGSVESIAWASGDAQGVPAGYLPSEKDIRPPEEFFVRLGLIKENLQYPLRFGASGIAVIYTKTCPDFLKIIRRIEIQSESYLNFLFNPF